MRIGLQFVKIYKLFDNFNILFFFKIWLLNNKDLFHQKINFRERRWLHAVKNWHLFGPLPTYNVANRQPVKRFQNVFGHPRGNWKQKNCFHSPQWGEWKQFFCFQWVEWKQFFCFQSPPPIDFSCPPQIYRYCDTLYKMWQMNNRDCNKKSTVTDSACKKRLTVNGKSRL